MPAVYHAVAKCRWCGGRFVKVLGHWFCESEPCAARQRAEAVTNLAAVEGDSPYLFVPLPLQVDTDCIPTKRLLVHGAAGVSKSYGGRWSAYKWARKIPGFRVLLLRCTYDQLEKNHLQFMSAEAKLLGDAKYFSGNPKHMEFTNGSDVRFGYCDDDGDIVQHLGAEWDLVIFEEGTHFLPRALQEISARDRGSSTSRLARERLEGWAEGRTRILTNPGGRGARYLDDFYIQRQPDPSEFPHYVDAQYGHISGTIADNPYLSETYESSVLGGLSKDRWEQLARGRWDIYPGQFFAAFDPKMHVVEMEP
jgi:phage terminase large subunit